MVQKARVVVDRVVEERDADAVRARLLFALSGYERVVERKGGDKGEEEDGGYR